MGEVHEIMEEIKAAKTIRELGKAQVKIRAIVEKAGVKRGDPIDKAIGKLCDAKLLVLVLDRAV